MSELLYLDLKMLSEDQLNKIVKIDNAIPSEFDATWKPTDTDHTRRLKFYHDLLDTDFFKAVLNGDEIVAFYCIRAAQIGSTNIGMATTVWVHPGHRKSGIARHLHEMGIDWAKSQKIAYFQSSVHSTNHRSRELHEKSGFETYAITYRLKI